MGVRRSPRSISLLARLTTVLMVGLIGIGTGDVIATATHLRHWPFIAGFGGSAALIAGLWQLRDLHREAR